MRSKIYKRLLFRRGATAGRCERHSEPEETSVPKLEKRERESKKDMEREGEIEWGERKNVPSLYFMMFSEITIDIDK